MRTTGLVPEWDDRLWDHVWERNLTQVERHNTGLAVLRHRPPGSPFEDLVARELAHRWRRRAMTLAVMWAAWTTFWTALLLDPWPDDVEPSPLPLGCAVVGLVVVVGCLLARRRFTHYLALVRDDGTRPADRSRRRSGRAPR